MKRIFKISLAISLLIALFLPAKLCAQGRAISPNDTIVPVRKLPNGNVLFSVYAPKAREVVLKGDVANYNNEITTRESKTGVWTFEVTNVPEGALRYYYIIDGVATMEPTSSKPNIQTNVYNLDKGDEFFAYRKDIPHGSVSVHFYESTVIGQTRSVHVWTPAGYEKNLGKKKLPVLYLIHGGGDDDSSWYRTGQANNILDNLLAEGKMEPMIVVMPNGTVKTETLAGEVPIFVEDLHECIVPFIESKYNVYTDPSHRAIAGLSMGGWETMETALAYYDDYDYVWVLSAGWHTSDQAKYEYESTHLKQIAADFNKTVKQFVLTQGNPEDIAYYNCQATRKLLDDAGIKYEYYSEPGGHTWYTWRKNLYALAQRIFK